MSQAELDPQHEGVPARGSGPTREGRPFVLGSEQTHVTEPELTSDQDGAVPSSGDGLARAVVIGGVIGFLIVFGLVATGLMLLDVYGVVPAFGAGAFVGTFGGIGFGAMVGGSLHH